MVGLPILRGRCKVVPYAGVSLVAARSSPKRRYVPLVDNASSSHSAFSARLPGWTFVVRSPIEARFHSFHLFIFCNTSLQFRRQYVRIILIKIYPSVDISPIHIALSSQIIRWCVRVGVDDCYNFLQAILFESSFIEGSSQMLVIRLLVYSWIYSGFFSSRFSSIFFAIVSVANLNLTKKVSLDYGRLLKLRLLQQGYIMVSNARFHVTKNSLKKKCINSSCLQQNVTTLHNNSA